MEIKKGRYAIYQGKEYKLYKNKDGTYNLVTNTNQDGFIEEYDNTFVKTIERREIERIIQVNPVAIYKNEQFGVKRSTNPNMVVIGTPKATLAKELGFNRTDKYYYEKEVPISTVELLEEKIEIT
jgi:hypothetical protein